MTVSRYQSGLFMVTSINEHYENERRKLVVELHDYKEKKEAFLAKNPGAEQGFDEAIEFTEFQLQELKEKRDSALAFLYELPYFKEMKEG